MDFLISGITSITPQQIVMYVIGAVLIWLAISKDLEPVLLLPLGFGAILVNLPDSGVLNQTLEGIGETNGIIQWLFDVGIEASEAMPILLFIGIGAMIDFGRSSVRYFRSHPGCRIPGLRPEGRGFHRYHRRCRRTYFHSCLPGAGIELCRAYRRGRLFLYGACSHHPAGGYPPAHNKKRALHPYGI